MAFSQQIKEGSTGAALRSGTLSVSTTAAQLSSSTDKIYGVLVEADQNNSANVYFGDSNVSTSNGITLFPAQKMSIPVSLMTAVYFITGTAGQTVRYAAIADSEE